MEGWGGERERARFHGEGMSKRGTFRTKLRPLSLPLRSLSGSWNLFDVLVVVISLVGLADNNLPGATTVIRHNCTRVPAPTEKTHSHTLLDTLIPTQ